MAKKSKQDFSNMDTSELVKKLQEAELSVRKERFELKSGKNTAHKGYRNARRVIAQIKTELAKRG